MNGVGDEMQKQRWGVFAGILLGLFFLHKLRKRRKIKKILKNRAKVRAKMDKGRKKDVKSKAKTMAKTKVAAQAKPSKKAKKKAKKDKTVAQQLISFTILTLMKKIISQQIKQIEPGLSKAKLGKTVIEAAES